MVLCLFSRNNVQLAKTTKFLFTHALLRYVYSSYLWIAELIALKLIFTGIVKAAQFVIYYLGEGDLLFPVV